MRRKNSLLPVAFAIAQWNCPSARNASSGVVATSWLSRACFISSMFSAVRQFAARRAAGTSMHRRTSFKSPAEYCPKESVSFVTFEATKVPLPGRDSVRPSARSLPSPSLTMGRLTPKRRASSASDGRRSFTPILPDSMRATSWARTSSTTLRRTMRSKGSASRSRSERPVEPAGRLSDKFTALRIAHFN